MIEVLWQGGIGEVFTVPVGLGPAHRLLPCSGEAQDSLAGGVEKRHALFSFLITEALGPIDVRCSGSEPLKIWSAIRFFIFQMRLQGKLKTS